MIEKHQDICFLQKNGEFIPLIDFCQLTIELMRAAFNQGNIKEKTIDVISLFTLNV